ncbi:hypothetical protein ACJW8B_15575 [Plesiomonas shigelloides]|uniref:hypothetical protein n=1 Tax=Plesiomonas shigelloides TaxID=703 RepID=UPI00387F1A93
MELKTTVDILSSITSIIAISTVLFSWYKQKRSPLSVSRVLIHQYKDSSVCHFHIINKENYPIEISSIISFTEMTYRISQENGRKPEIDEYFDYSTYVFDKTIDENIQPKGMLKIKATIDNIECDIEHIRKMIMGLYTSHGYLQLQAKDITLISIGTASSAKLINFEKEYTSKTAQVLNYTTLILKYYFRKIFKKRL